MDSEKLEDLSLDDSTGHKTSSEKGNIGLHGESKNDNVSGIKKEERHEAKMKLQERLEAKRAVSVQIF